jgi:hypothetical protein
MSWQLLRDYAQRTSGAWLLVGFIQIIQSVTFWAEGVRRAPLLGAVLGGLIYALSSEQPQHVLQTLPLTRTSRVLFRWLASFALPAAVVLACMAAAGALNIYKEWPLPGPTTLVSSALVAITLLGWLTAFPARGYAMIVWGAAALAGLIGLPTEVAVSLPVVGFLSLAMSMALSLAMSFVESPGSVRGLAKTDPRARFHGWGVLLVEVGRSTALLSAGALAATVIIHGSIPQRLLPGLHGALIWLFVSAIAAATCLPMRRWVEAVRSLRILPLDSHRLALTLYFILTLPGVVTCLVMMAAQALSPNWGLDIPPYMLVVFLLAPITLVRWYRPYEGRPNVVLQQWAPALQQAAWPLWAGALCSLRGLAYMPAWFMAYLGVIALFFSVMGYRALLSGIRSTAALEGEPLVLLDAA